MKKLLKDKQRLANLILQSFNDKNLEGWKDDKEQFKIDLINDIKDFLLGKWEKPWKPGLIFDDNNKVVAGFRNVSGRVYGHESNILSLKSNASESPYFITLSKLATEGGSITDETKKVGILSFIPMFKKGNEPDPGEKKAPDFRLPKMHQVINVDFTSGIKKPAYNKVEFEALELNEYVENFIKELKKLKRIPKLTYDQADRAYYAHTHTFSTDKIHLVPINNFKNIEAYYSTLFHEITHSTMNPERCGRGKYKFENKLDYPNEELVAEMGAMIVASELGLAYNRQNSITYLKGWLSSVKGDKDEALLESYAFACDAAEYLMDDINFDKLVPKSMESRAKVEQKEKDQPAVEHIKPEFVSYNSAYNAHRGTSMDPEKRAKMYQNAFAEESNEFADRINAIANTEEQKARAKVLFKDYLERRKSKWTIWMNAKSRCLSILVTGASNFPVRRNEKANNTEHKRGEEYFYFIEKAEKNILAEIKNLDKESLAKEKNDENSKKILSDLATILGIVKRELPYSKSLIVNSMMRKLEKMPSEARSYAIQKAKEIQEKHNVTLFAKNHRFWKITDNREEVKEAEVNKGEETIFVSEEVKVINSFTDERIRIMHEDKPAKEVIAYLKSHGFKWSPQNKAWQRMNTAFGIKEAHIFIDKFCLTEEKESGSKSHKPKQLALALNGVPVSSKSKKDIRMLIRFYNCLGQERQKRSLRTIQKSIENSLKTIDKDVVYYPFMVKSNLMLKAIIQQMNDHRLTHVKLEITEKSNEFFNELSSFLTNPESCKKPKTTASLNGSSNDNIDLSNIKEVNERFNNEINALKNNNLAADHIFQLGIASKKLIESGIKPLPIQLNLSRLKTKSKDKFHPFKIEHIKNLPISIANPIAIFSYGDKDKSQNIICELESNGKKFLVGIFYYKTMELIEINSIRGLFPKELHEWLNWIQQGKLLGINKKKVLNLINQQRTNLADVDYLDLELITNIVKNFGKIKLSGVEDTEGSVVKGKRNTASELSGTGKKKPYNLFSVNKAFNEDLNLYNKHKHKGNEFNLGMPGKVLIESGLEKLPIKLSKATLTLKKKKHNFDISLLKDLPKKLSNPAFVFDSKRKGEKEFGISKLVVIGGKVENEGVFSVVISKVTHDCYVINKIESIGGRNAKQLWYNIEEGNLLEHNKAKVLTILPDSLIVSDSNSQDFITKIQQYLGISNTNLSGKDELATGPNGSDTMEQDSVVVNRFVVDMTKPTNTEVLNGFEDVPEQKEKTEKSDLFTPITAQIEDSGLGKIELPGDLGKFLGYIERYEYSILLRGEKGAGKTRLTYQLMNTFAKAGFSVGCFSLEIGKQSNIVRDMRNTYISPTIADKVFIADSAPNGLQDIKAAAKQFDAVFIDSWGKIPGVKSEDFDKLRKEFPETMFIVIFQSTTNGTARGGSAPEYDAGIVIQVADGGKAYCEKNRYNGEDLTYLVFERKLAQPETAQ